MDHANIPVAYNQTVFSSLQPLHGRTEYVTVDFTFKKYERAAHEESPLMMHARQGSSTHFYNSSNINFVFYSPLQHGGKFFRDR